MKIINFIFSKIKLGRLSSRIQKLNKRYFAIVSADWKKLGYTKTTMCYPINKHLKKKEFDVNLYTGIKLALACPVKQEIVLAWFDKEDINLIKNYVSLLGFDTSIVKAS